MHKGDVLIGRDFDRLFTGVQPRKRVIAVSISSVPLEEGFTYAPADIRGQVVELQIDVPSSSLS